MSKGLDEKFAAVALKQKMAQIIFVLLLVGVMVVSYAGGRSGGELGGFVKPAKVN